LFVNKQVRLIVVMFRLGTWIVWKQSWPCFWSRHFNCFTLFLETQHREGN